MEPVGLGVGRADLFGSAFDGGFELPGLATWSTEGTVAVVSSFGPLVPTEGGRMGYLATGGSAAPRLLKEFVVQPGVGEFAISFDYDFISGQWPELAGDPLSDRMRIVLEQGGTSTLLAIETVASSSFTILEGVSLPGSSGSVGHTGWRRGAAVVPVVPGAASYVVRIEESGPSSAVSVLLLDRIVLTLSPGQLYCGAPLAGSCCEVHEAPFCADGSCCASVCGVDPTCCTATWDATCVQLARAICGDLCPPPTVASTFRGHVTTPQGSPFGGATVSIGDFSTQTDLQGFYSLDAQVPGGAGTVLVTAVATVEGRVYSSSVPSGQVVPNGVTPVPTLVLGPEGGCITTSLTPPTAPFEAAGGTGSVAITTSGAVCSWSATSSSAWLVITSGGTGTGASGTIGYVVEANQSSSSRTGTISAGGLVHVVTQAAGPQATTFTGVVVLEGGAPLPNAVVVTDLGGTAVTSPTGAYSLVTGVLAGTTSVTLTATATIDGTTYQGSAVVSPVAAGGTNQVPPITALPVGGGCEGEFAWLPGIGQPGMNGSVNALAVFDDGSGPALYAGGSFQSAGGIEAYSIARWNGESWSDVGIGVGGEVRALAVFDDGSGPALYAGGSLAVLVSGPVRGIARWNGQSWSPVGEGLGNGGQDRVSALAVFDDGGGPALYVGGLFQQAGGVPVNFIARWDGAAWSPLAGTTLLQVGGGPTSLAVFDDGSGPALYAGGSFSEAQLGAGNRIAKWNGQSWSPLGSGMNDQVLSLGVFDDGNGAALYAGGWFTTAGGLEAKGIARWDGASWSPLGGGVDAQAQAIMPFDDGSGPALFVGGNFGFAGPWPASAIAKWGCFTP